MFISLSLSLSLSLSASFSICSEIDYSGTQRTLLERSQARGRLGKLKKKGNGKVHIVSSFICLFICLLVGLFFVCLFVCLFVCFSFVCLFVCTFRSFLSSHDSTNLYPNFSICSDSYYSFIYFFSPSFND